MTRWWSDVLGMGVRELAADAAQIVAVQEIRVSVLADGEDQLSYALGARDVERKGRRSAEIEILSVEVLPVRRCESVARPRPGGRGREQSGAPLRRRSIP